MRRLGILFFLTLTVVVNGQLSWTKLKNQPHLFKTGGSVVVNNIAYYLDLEDQTLWVYDVKTDQWDRQSIYPGSQRSNITLFAVGNFAYAFGSDMWSMCSEMWRFDTYSGVWTRMHNVPWDLIRDNATVATAGNKAYLAGGFHMSEGRKEDCWEYNPETDSWRIINGFPVAGGWTHAYSFVIDDKIYFGGAWGSSYDPSPGYLFSYSVKDSVWTRLHGDPYCAPWGIGWWNDVFKGITWVIDGKAYLVSADSMGRCSNQFKVYDPETNRWSRLISQTPKRIGAIGFTLNNRGYVGFGRPCQTNDPSFFNDFYTFGKGNVHVEPLTTSVKDEVQNYSFMVCQEGNQITIKGFEESSTIEIFDLSAKRIYTNSNCSGERIFILTDTLPEGLYFVTCKSSDYKVNKIYIKH